MAVSAVYDVNCRVGSLEIDWSNPPEGIDVNCRVGSLERRKRRCEGAFHVNCRVGSLEIEATVF